MAIEDSFAKTTRSRNLACAPKTELRANFFNFASCSNQYFARNSENQGRVVSSLTSTGS